MSAVTTTDILAALRNAMGQPPVRPNGAFLASELAEQMGVTVERVRKYLGKLIAAGQAEPVSVVITRIDGKTQTTSGYRLIKGKSK